METNTQYDNAREKLSKQLELLAERSQWDVSTSELVELSDAMVRVCTLVVEIQERQSAKCADALYQPIEKGRNGLGMSVYFD